LNQIRQLLSQLSQRQKISLGVALVAVLGGLYWFVDHRQQQDYKLLFREMAPEDAGQLTNRLKEKNVEYKIGEDGASVYVRSARLNELRLELAAEGIPRSGRIGFEIFDKTNFALTEFAEQVNYQRALEGELERTVAGLAEVEQARVHLTFAKQSIFVDNRQPAKASVVLKLRQGRRLSPVSIQSVVFLLSSAVEGLTPDQVSIIDHTGALLNRPRKAHNPEEEFPEILLEYRQKLERDLLTKVNSTLTPLLGEDRYRASVTVDCDITSAEASEEIYDPEKSVVTSEQKTEDLSGLALASGVPGTPSSLPRPTSRPASSSTGAQRKTESTNYQASRSIRRTRIPQGQVKRVSLSVLLDQGMRWEGVGPQAKRVFDTPSPEKIKTIKDVVAAAVGLVPERGDQVIVESLPFDATLRIPPPAAPVAPAPPKPLFEIPEFLRKFLPAPLQDPAVLLAVILAAAVLVGAIGFAAFWFLNKRKKKAVLAGGAASAALEGRGEGAALLAEEDPLAAVRAQLGEDDGRSLEERLAEQQELQRRLEQKELAKLKMPEVTTQKGKILQQHISEEAQKDPVMIAQILRSWLYADRERER
jgi:flagellar M-ring protein FliF